MSEEFHGLAPRGLLVAVEFAEVEDGPLKDASAHDAAVLDDAPVEMLLAVLVSFFAAQKHGWDYTTPGRWGARGWVGTTATFGTRTSVNQRFQRLTWLKIGGFCRESAKSG